VTGRRFIRRLLTKWVKRYLGFQGYFDLYNIPFQYIDRYDFTEKRSPLQPGGMNQGENIFDELAALKIPYHVNDSTKPESETKDELLRTIAE
jgi:hypothetical protein